MLRWIQLLCALAVATPAFADPAALGDLPAVAALRPPSEPAPPAPDAARARALWDESQRLENGDDFLGAADLRMEVAKLRPEDAHVRWRIARDLLHGVKTIPHSEGDARVDVFHSARDWARAGAELDPDCGECCLYEFAAIAQLATEEGLARSVGHVREAGTLLEQCLEMPPTWTEPRFGAERGQLYYGAAAFFRMLPEGAWARWVLGLRGDPERAVALARRATQVSPDEPAYRVELGAALLCHAARTGDRVSDAEGRRLLASIDAPEGVDSSRARASQLLAEPDRACDDSEHYGRVSWR